ncbi:MAG: Na+/H+ antiporter subunit E [Alphaproteobacteria bacterium]|nr:Na+/H+ antiporter subunit E [Alphaproteobacteria bacterium]
MVRSALLAVALFAFWVVLSGFFTAYLLTAGACCALLIVAVARRMSVVDSEGYPVHLTWRAMAYWPWLLWEIVKSAWDVTKIIMDPRLPISPTMVRVKAGQRTTVGKVTYANSITLTPGTISVDLEGDEILVHAVTRGGAESLAAGDMDRRVTRFEGAPRQAAAA